MTARNQLLRKLPSVDSILQRADVLALLERHPRELVLEGIRRALESRRAALMGGQRDPEPGREQVSAEDVAAEIQAFSRPPLRAVINATGVVLHTNLGRAPLLPEAASRVAEIAAGYSNLEMELESGERGHRMDLVRDLLLELTGAEDALVVNNNAAAIYLALRTLAAGREAVVSRGELVEIGGSFRIPDVMAASGARLVEVGTTNKTRAADYRRVIGPETALILKVHRSNFELIGFTEEVAIPELAGLAAEAGIPLVMDMGSGTLIEGLPPAFGDAPTVRKLLGQGIDLLCFSGDKMLGGPQAGILVGKKRWIERLAKDPMARALRVGKLTLAALWATLACYRGGTEGARAVPVVDMLLADPAVLRKRAERLAELLRASSPTLAQEIVPTEGQVGGGALPLVSLPGFGVALTPADGDAKGLADRLRRGEPPVVGRLHQERVVLDVRTLLGVEEERALAEAVRKALRE